MKSKWLNIFLFLLVCGGIAYMLSTKSLSMMALWHKTKEVATGPKKFLVLLIFLLTLVNYLFEALKWQYVAAKIEKLSLWQAYKGVLAGLSLGFNTPATVGDFAGRILTMKNKERERAVGAIALGNGMQLFINFIGGVIALWVFVGIIHFAWYLVVLNILFTLFVVVGFYIMHRGISISFFNRKYFRNFKKYIDIIETYSSQEMISVLLFATGRYSIMILQFVLAFYLFGVNISVFWLSVLVALILLSKTVVPMINFASDLGVREAATLYFFGFFGVNIVSVTAATMMIWVFNLLFPIVAGAFALLSIKMKAE